MKQLKPDLRRQVLGRVSVATQGPPGLHMEVSGQWDKPGLTG